MCLRSRGITVTFVPIPTMLPWDVPITAEYPRLPQYYRDPHPRAVQFSTLQPISDYQKISSGVARHFLTVRTYDFWRHNLKIKIRVYSKVMTKGLYLYLSWNQAGHWWKGFTLSADYNLSILAVKVSSVNGVTALYSLSTFYFLSLSLSLYDRPRLESIDGVEWWLVFLLGRTASTAKDAIRFL